MRKQQSITNKQTYIKRDYEGTSKEMEGEGKEDILHWCGVHIDCTHQQLPPPKYTTLVVDGDGATKLKELFQPYKENSHKYATATSSNVCEAINSKITIYAPKRLNLTSSYDWRASLALL